MRTGGIVDMFLTAILRTGTKNDYLFRFLVPCGDGMLPAPPKLRNISQILISRERIESAALDAAERVVNTWKSR